MQSQHEPVPGNVSDDARRDFKHAVVITETVMLEQAEPIDCWFAFSGRHIPGTLQSIIKPGLYRFRLRHNAERFAGRVNSVVPHAALLQRL